MKRLISFFLLTALLLTGCTQKEEAKPHVAAYENANALLAEGKYADAALIFESLNGYEESVLLCMYARAKDKLSKGEYAEAFKGFVALGDFRDSALSAIYADACLLASSQNAYDMVEGAEALDEIALYLDSAVRAEKTRASLYARAGKHLEAGEYSNAISDFDALGTYRDSALMHKYALALSYESMGVDNTRVYLCAVDVFEDLGSFKDSRDRAENVLRSVYAEAERLLSQGSPTKAEYLFDMLAQPEENNWTNRKRIAYLDSEEMVRYCQIAALADKGGARNLVNAAWRFENMAPFRDTEARAQELRKQAYQMGITLMEQAQYTEAEEIFLLQDFEDSHDMANYANASAIEKEAETAPEYYIDAGKAFEEIGDFKDSPQRAEATKEKLYLASVSVLDSGDYPYAEYLFTLSNYADSQNLWLYAGAMNDVQNANGDADRLLFAARTFESIKDTRDSGARAISIRDGIYEKAMTALKNGEYDSAEALFAKQNYKDSANMVVYTRAARVENMNTPEKYIEAAQMYEKLNGFSDSAERAENLRKLVYDSAAAALSACDFKTAEDNFALQDYKDSKEMIAYVEAAALAHSSEVKNRVSAAEKYEAMNGFKDSAKKAKEIRESVYESAQKALKENNFTDAQRLFGLQDYKDSKEMVPYTLAVQQEYAGSRIEAVKQFYAMGDFNGSSDRANRILDAMLEEAKSYEDNHKYDKAHEIYVAMGEYRNGVALSKYVLSEKALYEAGDDPERKIQAAVSFENLNSIFDSAQRAEAIRKEVYESAQTALENGFYQEAAMIFSLQDYEDGEDLASYASALHLAYGNKASYAQKIKAAELLELMPQVRDSAEQARKIRISLTELAHEKLLAGYYIEAMDLFLLQPEWEQNALYASYAEARGAENAGRGDPAYFVKAYKIYTSRLKGQLDADERAKNCIETAYKTAWEYYETKKYDQAIALFALMDTYKESANAKMYAEAEKTLNNALDNAKEYVKAKEIYVSLGDYRDSKAAAEKIDKQLFVRFVDDIGVFTKEGLARFEKNGKWGYVSISGEVIVNAKYDMAYDFSEGLAAVKLGDKWGYIDPRGNVVIQMKYEKARSFSDGMAAVLENNNWKFVTKAGNIVNLKSSVSTYYSDYINYFENGFVFIEAYNNYDRYVMNKSGEIVSHHSPLSFSEGIAVVSDRWAGGFNYMREDGSYLRNEDWPWKEARPFENGRGIVKAETKNGDKYGIVDTKGKYVSNPNWDEIQSATDGIFLVKKDGNYGYIGMNGDTVSAVQWNYAYPFSDSLALVWKNGYYGYIDTNGNTAIDFVYDEAHSFKDGFAFVKQYGAWKCLDTNGDTVFEIDERVNAVHGSAKENRILVSGSDGKYGYIDQSGKIVIDMTWGNASAIFSEGLTYVSNNASYWRDGSFIDESGAIVIKDAGDKFAYFENDVAVKMVSGYSEYYYLMNRSGADITQSSYRSIVRMNQDRFGINSSGYYGVIDSNGSIICPAIYDNIDIVTEQKDGKTVFVSATAKNSSLYNSGRNECEWFPIDENGRALPRSGVDETGVFALKQNGVWYFTDADGEIIF